LTAPLTAWAVVAHNTATASNNKIHDDAVAKRLGFGGGLVPGVDLYAYLSHPPAEAWGLDWLSRGTLWARFVKPVYEGEPLVVDPTGIINPAGVRCAEAKAGLDEGGVETVDPAKWPVVPQVEDRPPASPESLAVGTGLGLEGHRFVADRAGEYLDAVRETLPIYTDARVAHPGWILRKANDVLAGNVVLGPWIHVESTTQHLGLVEDGALVATRAIVTGEWEQKGHRFVRLDVLVAADDRPVARIDHTAIYRPRQLA
jgi:hypothetical protein